MRHTRCTDRSINTVDVDSLSDTKGEMDRTKFGCVRHIDDTVFSWHKSLYTRIYRHTIYVMGGEQSIYELSGGGEGGGRSVGERQRLYAAEQLVKMRSDSAFRRGAMQRR